MSGSYDILVIMLGSYGIPVIMLGSYDILVIMLGSYDILVIVGRGAGRRPMSRCSRRRSRSLRSGRPRPTNCDSNSSGRFRHSVAPSKWRISHYGVLAITY